MPSTPFGDHLKREREMRGVTLEEISAATRISERFLEALESGQWERLPGGAFNRGFIRSVAHFLGLDEDSMVAEYALETKGLGQPTSTVDLRNQGMPRDWRPVIAIGVGILVMLLAGAFALHHFREKARARALGQIATHAEPSQETPPSSNPSTNGPAPEASH